MQLTMAGIMLSWRPLFGIQLPRCTNAHWSSSLHSGRCCRSIKWHMPLLSQVANFPVYRLLKLYLSTMVHLPQNHRVSIHLNFTLLKYSARKWNTNVCLMQNTIGTMHVLKLLVAILYLADVQNNSTWLRKMLWQYIQGYFYLFFFSRFHTFQTYWFHIHLSYTAFYSCQNLYHSICMHAWLIQF